MTAVRTIRDRAHRCGYRLVICDGTAEVFSGYEAVLPSWSGQLDSCGDWLADQLKELGRKPGPARAEVPEPWRCWLDRYTAELDAAQASPETIATRVGHIVTFARHHPDGPLTITHDQLAAWVGDRGRKPRTAYSIRASMRSFFGFLARHRHRPDDPAATLPPIRLPRSRPRPASDDAVRHALTTVTDPRVWLAIKVLVETGLRRAEVTRLQTSDVEGGPGDYRLHVVGKGGHERAVPVSDDLAALIGDQPGPYVVATASGEPVTPRHLGRLVAAALPAGYTTHTLRHRFATAAYRATGDLRAVQELLGHASPTTTAVYTQVADTAMRRAAEAARLVSDLE